MSDMLKTIAPKSDQLNADDLIGGRTLTIKITRVSILAGEQPVALNYEGDNGKPWKPCKSMRRVLVTVWGGDGNKYVGRSLTLYRDADVLFAGAKVGGIRISHMSDIAEPMTIALTASKAVRKPYTVRPLTELPAAPAPLTSLLEGYAACQDAGAFAALETGRKAIWGTLKPADQKRLKTASDEASKRIAEKVPGVDED